MGRGRQKAKQTKVARELKYQHQVTDYAALSRELTGTEPVGAKPEPVTVPVDEPEDDGDYRVYLKDLNDDDYGPVTSRR